MEETNPLLQRGKGSIFVQAQKDIGIQYIDHVICHPNPTEPRCLPFHLLPTINDGHNSNHHSSEPFSPPPSQPSIARQHVRTSSYESRSSSRQSCRPQFLEPRCQEGSRALRMCSFRVALLFSLMIPLRILANSNSIILTYLQLLMAVMSGAFGLAGYYFGQTPTVDRTMETSVDLSYRQKPHICNLGK